MKNRSNRNLIRVIFTIIFLFSALLVNNANNYVVEANEIAPFSIYLPIVLKGGTSGSEPVNPMPGQNEQCSTSGNAQICASVSDSSPKQYSNVTVYGRLLINGSPQSEKPMHTVWHYKSSSPTCDDGVTDSNGIASCTRGISRATIGYEVVINVEIEGYQVNTSFTPAN